MKPLAILALAVALEAGFLLSAAARSRSARMRSAATRR
jgi:hypothetical protein